MRIKGAAFVAAIIAFASVAAAQETGIVGKGTVLNSAGQVTTLNPHPNIIIQCGRGSISISTKDGSVKFADCSPDEGALAFWSAVERMGVARHP